MSCRKTGNTVCCYYTKSDLDKVISLSPSSHMNGQALPQGPLAARFHSYNTLCALTAGPWPHPTWPKSPDLKLYLEKLHSLPKKLYIASLSVQFAAVSCLSGGSHFPGLFLPNKSLGHVTLWYSLTSSCQDTVPSILATALKVSEVESSRKDNEIGLSASWD